MLCIKGIHAFLVRKAKAIDESLIGDDISCGIYEFEITKGPEALFYRLEQSDSHHIPRRCRVNYK